MDKAILIMAGGSGSRLWPLSRRKNPKQSHRLFSDVSTFENLLNIVQSQVPLDHIYVSVGESQYDYVKQSGVLMNNILLQKKNKNTAPAILYGVNKIVEDLGDCNVAMLPSDHLIIDENSYNKAVEAAFDAAMKTKTIIAIGTKPIYPSTGFGYIEIDYNEPGIKKVMTFKEKPSQELAVQYIADGHLWNTGIYVSRSDVLLETYRKNLPEMSSYLSKEDVFFDFAESISFDFGIVEKMNNMHVIVSSHSWLDIGTYEFLEHYIKPDINGNIIQGNGMVFDAKSTSIVSETGTVVAYGTSDLLIVNTHDVVFVCDKKFLQRIGNLVDRLEENEGESLL
jgi:mannose-1-phosphate guanylyltransferase